jgi:CBS domain-containing protein
MKSMNVNSLMVPLSDYATISEDSYVYQAMIALKKAQTEYNKKRYLHRAILVYNKNKKIVGKLSQSDVIKAMEPDFKKIINGDSLSRFGISDEFLKNVMNTYDFWDLPLDAMCKTAGKIKVGDIMYVPTNQEYVEENSTLKEAVHRLIVGNHHSLLVTKNNEITGILRLADIFETVEEYMEMIFTENDK